MERVEHKLDKVNEKLLKVIVHPQLKIQTLLLETFIILTNLTQCRDDELKVSPCIATKNMLKRLSIPLCFFMYPRVTKEPYEH